MRIGMQTWGSEGDIRPFLALGHALAARGHQVELLYTEIADRWYGHVAEALGFTARAVASPILLDKEQQYEVGLRAINARDPFQQGLIIFKELLYPVANTLYNAGLELAMRSDVFVHHFVLYPARAAADMAGKPSITVGFAHMLTPSRHIHPTGLPHLGAWANGFEWKIAQFALNRTLLRHVNRFRTQRRLHTFRDLLEEAWPSPVLNLLASSPAFLDRPSDWPAANQMCGFLALPAHEHEALSDEVDAFLSAGAPPVFMGFGSLMPPGGPHLDETIATFEESAARADCRAIIQAEVDRPATDRVLFVKRTPHAVVFPRCAAVVHHAGAGTTHATLRAGTPSVPVPHVSDQFLWADELERLGAAPEQLRRTEWSPTALCGRIKEAIGNDAMKQAAMAMRERMKNDDGPATAAEMIERAASSLK
jgi:UDP:flavonoid glycosyltransferase YjiC (YdhE family)